MELCDPGHKIGLGMRLGFVWRLTGDWEEGSLDTSDFGASI